MALVTLILDSPVAYPGLPAGSDTVLTLPLGAGLVFDSLCSRLDGAGCGDVLVMPSTPVDGPYTDVLRSRGRREVAVVAPGGLPAILRQYETSDSLLVVEARRWLANDWDTAFVHRLHQDDYRGATYVAAVGGDVDGAREFIEYAPGGDVQGVRRLYNLVNWPRVASSALACSVVPIWAIGDASFTSLGELRLVLSSRGVLGRDMPLACDIVDLGDEYTYLALHERVLHEMAAGEPPPGFDRPSAGVFLARDARVASGARLLPPVVVHEGAEIGPDALIVGPTLIGRNSRIGCGASVVHSVLTPAVRVRDGVTVRHRVVSGECATSLGDVGAAVESALTALEVHDGQDPSGRSSTAAAPLDATRHRIHLAAKRAIDVVASLLGLVALSPFLLAIAALVKLDSRGPVFFVHRRERKGGRDFPCLKFRTMVVGAHEQQRVLYRENLVDGPQFKLRHDPRVTRVGRWLRATNLDELPQLINVLAGHMSLVGPRPSPFRENQVCVAWRKARLSVRPGITGLWQICRDDDRSQGDFHQWIFYDIAYVRHFSIWLDLKILWWTAATFGGRWSVPMSWVIPGADGYVRAVGGKASR